MDEGPLEAELETALLELLKSQGALVEERFEPCNEFSFDFGSNVDLEDESQSEMVASEVATQEFLLINNEQADEAIGDHSHIESKSNSITNSESEGHDNVAEVVAFVKFEQDWQVISNITKQKSSALDGGERFLGIDDGKHVSFIAMQTSIHETYAKYGCIYDAHKVFDERCDRDSEIRTTRVIENELEDNKDMLLGELPIDKRTHYDFSDDYLLEPYEVLESINVSCEELISWVGEIYYYVIVIDPGGVICHEYSTFVSSCSYLVEILLFAQGNGSRNAHVARNVNFYRTMICLFDHGDSWTDFSFIIVLILELVSSGMINSIKEEGKKNTRELLMKTTKAFIQLVVEKESKFEINGAIWCLEIWHNTVRIHVAVNMERGQASTMLYLYAIYLYSTISWWDFLTAPSVRMVSELRKERSKTSKFPIVITVLTSIAMGFLLYMEHLFELDLNNHSLQFNTSLMIIILYDVYKGDGLWVLLSENKFFWKVYLLNQIDHTHAINSVHVYLGEWDPVKWFLMLMTAKKCEEKLRKYTLSLLQCGSNSIVMILSARVMLPQDVDIAELFLWLVTARTTLCTSFWLVLILVVLFYISGTRKVNSLVGVTGFPFDPGLFHCIYTPHYKVTPVDFLLVDEFTSQVQAFRSPKFYTSYHRWEALFEKEGVALSNIGRMINSVAQISDIAPWTICDFAYDHQTKATNEKKGMATTEISLATTAKAIRRLSKLLEHPSSMSPLMYFREPKS
ncbi:Protein DETOXIFICATION 21 [Senna tora]|uniref:Protein DETOXIFICATION 21 n=1 Tax=Senna tora TaxID=362788 RepID=A0A834X6W9_9FABA|nr:Protein DETOXIFICATION 21 [Senna tora]